MKVKRLVGEYFIYNNPTMITHNFYILIEVEDIVWTILWKMEIQDKKPLW
jgi:hypothetical protein